MKRPLALGFVAIALGAVPLLAQSPVKIRAVKPLQTVKADLNGDGRPEAIRLFAKGRDGGFELVVNGVARASGNLDGPVDRFDVVDIDRSDRYREVAVHTEGPSDDDQYLHFWYDGARLNRSGLLERWPKYLGNGIVMVAQHEGFWASQNKYVLRKNHTLQEVPQEFYRVGLTGTVRKPMTLLQTRKGAPLANLRVGSRVSVLVGDKKGWFLVKSENDLAGWIQERDLTGKAEGFPYAD